MLPIKAYFYLYSIKAYLFTLFIFILLSTRHTTLHLYVHNLLEGLPLVSNHDAQFKGEAVHLQV